MRRHVSKTRVWVTMQKGRLHVEFSQQLIQLLRFGIQCRWLIGQEEEGFLPARERQRRDAVGTQKAGRINGCTRPMQTFSKASD